MYRMTHFQALLKPLSRARFEQSVELSGADKHSKGFHSYHLLLSLIAGQLQGARSFRELEAGINVHDGAFYHLGMRTVRRSTLSDALKKRSDQPFKDACEQLMGLAHRSLRRESRELLYLIDSTNISLHQAVYSSWTELTKSDRLKGLKVHVQLASDYTLPVYMNIDHANVNDVTDAQHIEIEAGATYAFDRGYTAYNWWKQIDEQGGYFVTRIKRNAAYRVVRHLQVDTSESAIISDDEIHLTNKQPRGGSINRYANQPLRVIQVRREGHPTPLSLVTNDFNRSATDIAEIYKKRWDIELFFKWLKQNLKIKKFLGTSENAVRLQLYAAMITYLLVAIAHYSQRTAETLKQLLVMTTSRLFLAVDDNRYQRHRYRQRQQHKNWFQQHQQVLL